MRCEHMTRSVSFLHITYHSPFMPRHAHTHTHTHIHLHMLSICIHATTLAKGALGFRPASPTLLYVDRVSSVGSEPLRAMPIFSPRFLMNCMVDRVRVHGSSKARETELLWCAGCGLLRIEALQKKRIFQLVEATRVKKNP
jgi:hypothetical protein